MARLLVLLVLLTTGAFATAQTTRQVVHDGPDQPNLLKEDGWRPHQKTSPYSREDGVFICDNGTDAKAQGGVYQGVALKQQTPQMIVASVWSKAEGVGGERDNDYSLYLDITYADGEPLYAQVATFKVGTHDWQQAKVKIIPAKPIKELAFHMLLRSHSGKALFKEPRLVQFAPAKGLAMFDGQMIKGDGGASEGFRVRDAAADGDFVGLESGEALGLKLKVKKTERLGATFYSGKLTDTTGKDRALTLVYTVPLYGDTWRWLAGPRHDEPAQAPLDYCTASRFGAVGSGRLSRYPLAAVAKDKLGRAIGMDMDKPAFFRVGYSAGTGELYIAYDFGLAKEKSSAEFSFCTYKFDGVSGFRGAVETFYDLFGEHFRCRTPKQGVWMPFYKISKVEGWQDFGFRFKEGNEETRWDDEHDIITFRYTEPMTWWMQMPKDMPRTFEGALAHARQMAEKGDANALALLTSGYHDDSGQFIAKMKNVAWCDGAVWSMNSSPGVAGDVTDFKNKWNADLQATLYGEKRKGDLDGEYIDSSEGYVTDELDYRREHLAAAGTPLTFSAENFKPAVFRGLAAGEYIREIARDMHAIGKLTMANGTPARLCWLAPHLDVLGTETDWNFRAKWQPMSDDDLLYRRVLCGPKPFCFLMNTDFAEFPHELVEKYMKRCLAYGMFPGFFSHNAAQGHYFSQPKLYNRDRDLFKKYIPLCKLVAEAGWQPVTAARSSDAKVYVERFGQKYLTVFNDSDKAKDAVITFDAKPPKSAKNLVSEANLPVTDGKVTLRLEPEDVAVISLE